MAGAQVPADLVDPSPERPHVVVVASRWGSDWGEKATAIRLFAGALLLRADVSVMSLEGDGLGSPESPGGDAAAPAFRYDGLFRVHSLPSSPGLEQIIESEPRTIVLAGEEALPLGRTLTALADRPRVVALPLCGTRGEAVLGLEPGGLDAMVAFSEAESRALGRQIGQRCSPLVRRLRLSFPVNRSAAAAGMAGMTSFGRYLLVLTALPGNDPLTGRCPPHEYLRQVLGGISIAEVREGRWLVTGADREHQVVWAPNRMNVWRLMAGAEATLDIRPPGPVGRETIESLLFGTPVVVPAGSVAAEHACESNGGLWYGSPGEMVDVVRRLIEDTELRGAMSSAGREWAERAHGEGGAFVDDALEVALDGA